MRVPDVSTWALFGLLALAAGCAEPGAGAIVQTAAAAPAENVELAPAVPPELAPDPGDDAEEARPRAWIGVALRKREAGEPGVLVREVVRGSPSAQAGIVVGDVILSVDGAGVSKPEEISGTIGARSPGERVSIGFARGDTTRLVAVTLADFPDRVEQLRMQFLGTSAPSFDALEVAQGSLAPSLAPLRGKVVVLEFWASWCPPCHLLGPVLETWHEQYQAQGVAVLGIAPEPLQVVTSSGLELGVDYPLFADPSGATTRAYGAHALPTLFLIDKQGRVRDLMVGYSTPVLTRLEDVLKKLLQES